MTDRELEARYPWIVWREPIRVTVPGGVVWACRYCVARGSSPIPTGDGAAYPRTREDFEAHLREAHPMGTPPRPPG